MIEQSRAPSHDIPENITAEFEADAIVFDKDGTLLDFDAFWVPVSEAAVGKTLATLGASDITTAVVLSAFGVTDGVTDVDGILCHGTYRQMAEVMHAVLCERGFAAEIERVESILLSAYTECMSAGAIKPTCRDLAKALEKLKSRGKKLAVVTTDKPDITLDCLRKLEIEHLFDAIYTDDGAFPPKPSPTSLFDFCNRHGILPERTVMVGDSMTDVRFAKNAGAAAVILATSERRIELFSDKADAVISSISALSELVR